MRLKNEKGYIPASLSLVLLLSPVFFSGISLYVVDGSYMDQFALFKKLIRYNKWEAFNFYLPELAG